MANRKISDLTALTAPDTGDLLPIVDISEAAAADQNKKITIGELFASIPLGTAAAPSVAFEGDANTGIFSPGADQVAISTNGTEKLIVKSDGKVGLGTSSPGNVLHVQSSIASSDLVYLYNTGSTASDVLRLNTEGVGSGTLIFDAQSAGSSRFVVRGDGNVGIGTTGPGGTLDIKATASTAPLIIQGPSSEFARIDSSGRLGLGVSSPTSLLHLADAGNITVGTTTGTKIGTATTQKLGFYNATPVVQPTAVANATTAIDVITQLNALLAKLRTLGIIAT
jgi:hypothetical protein